MQKQSARLAVLFILVVGLIAAFAAPAGAATNQLGGRGLRSWQCLAPPAGYEDFTDLPPLVMTGSLEGCWYTKILTTKDNGAPSGIYQGARRGGSSEASMAGPAGTFATTYKFTSKWDPDVSTGSEVHGRCEHPIVDGSGTGGF